MKVIIMHACNLSVVIPTYNESGNIKFLINFIEEVLKSNKIRGEILVVDDNSPDGTAKIVKVLQSEYKNLRLIIRPRREGLGAALREGYDNAKCDIILSIDADFSHDPKMIPILYKSALNDYDFVVGSRYAKGGGSIGKSFHRFLISLFGTFITSLMLSMNLHDYTNNFRAMKRAVWTDISRKIKFKTNIFLAECIYLANKYGYKCGETPIIFVERKHGKSKLNLFIEVIHYLFGIIWLRLH